MGQEFREESTDKLTAGRRDVDDVCRRQVEVPR